MIMQTPDAQDLARRSNEDEAVWRAFERRKNVIPRRGKLRGAAPMAFTK